ncbi:hypothetical protein CHISP_3349 [Chitinispirillum alkaliphilum]|nr:hypothetical protein CHISP_3349 [Chitinispirillum alkaliphilum]
MKKSRATLIPLFLSLLVIACGVSEDALNQAQAEIDQLESKGVPLENLSRPRVFIYQTRESMRQRNKGQARASFDSLMVHLEKAQKFYTEQVSNLGPAIEQKRAKAKAAKEELSGLQVKRIDSILSVADSFLEINWLLQANNVMKELVEMLPQIKEDEKKAVELRRTIPGEWKFSQVTTSTQHPEINATEEKILRFNRDGTTRFIERKKGQTNPNLKQDYEYRSFGTYDFAGDTIHLLIDRFVTVRKDMEELELVDDKPVWRLDQHETSDLTITDGSQNRFIPYSVLRRDYKQIRRF